MTRSTYYATDYRGTGPENYEKFFVPVIGGPLAEELVASASLRPGERVLDVACGTGVVTRLAARAVAKPGSVAGLDVNPGMLSVARSVTPKELGIEWYETSAEAMPLPDRSFDVVLCQMGFQFIPDKQKALREFRRIVKPGGRVLLSLPGPVPAMFTVLGEGLAKHIDPKTADFVNVVFSLHGAEELRRLVSDAPFTRVEVQKTHRTLRVPGPRDFLWQYIHSTPLSAAVAEASDEQREALENEVSGRWQEFVTARGRGSMRLEVDVTTVRAE